MGKSLKKCLAATALSLGLVLAAPSVGASYTDTVGDGVTVNGETIDTGAQTIQSGGVAAGTIIQENGKQEVEAGGTSNNVTMNGGTIESYGTVGDITVDAPYGRVSAYGGTVGAINATSGSQLSIDVGGNSVVESIDGNGGTLFFRSNSWNPGGGWADKIHRLDRRILVDDGS